MTGLVDWAAARARMVIAFIALSILAGTMAYVGLPKEGEPDIEIPALFISVPFPGISAEDSEKLLVKVMETELSDLDGLKKMSGTAAENYAGIALEFEFGWDKSKIMADVRDAMDTAEADFPDGAEKYVLSELNFSEFPIIIVNLTGAVPERTMSRLAKDLQTRLEGLEPVLEAGIAGKRDEMVEVVIDPLRLEAYNVTAGELISVVRNNNQLIAAGEVETDQGAFSVKIPSSFDDVHDIYELPVKTNGDRVVTLGDLARINLTFEDRVGTARFDGINSIALQVTKRKGYNIIDTANLVRETVQKAEAGWPAELKAAVNVGTSGDQSRTISSMVKQLEGSVLTAIALVMIVMLATLGVRPSLLVGFAIPTSFLLCFALLALMGVAISNMVMFGLILAVGMLVDGAIVVVEYADRRIEEGVGPMHAYVDAAKRMFWPVVSSTATTLCAFLPMLFWPGVPGQFMRMLPITLIFVLSASLLVALVYLPVIGGVTGRMERWFNDRINRIATGSWLLHVLLFPIAVTGLALAGYSVPVVIELVRNQFATMNMSAILLSVIPSLGAAFVLMMTALALTAAGATAGLAILLGLVAVPRRCRNILIALRRKFFPPSGEMVQSGYRRTLFGRFIHMIAGNPIAPLLAFCAIFVLVGTVLIYFINHNQGSEFFVDSEPENALVYVRARGNLSIEQEDSLVKQVEQIVLAHRNVKSVFAFAGDGGLDNNTHGARPPLDTIGQVQIEFIPWEDRPTTYEKWFTVPLINYDVQRQISDPAYDGDVTISELTAQLKSLPGIKTEILPLERGPASAKPVHLRIKGDDREKLQAFTALARKKFDQTEGLTLIEDTLPLPRIDWQIDVDVAKAGRFGADVVTVGAMVQLVTRGILLDTMRIDSSDDEVDIRIRLPEKDRILSTLDTLKVRTTDGLVPLSNFISREPVPGLAQIDRVDQTRYYDIKAGVEDGLTETIIAGDGSETTQIVTADTEIAKLTKWLDSGVLPAGLQYEWTGDAEDQAESGAFLQKAFLGALGLMFIILLAQFNSFYNGVLVLLAVVLSTTGVLIGMMVMSQPFSIIMTGTGIVALAGIVVNNNIVLIDTYQEFSRYMPKAEAITRTAEARIRPVLLTTITTMAGLAPMMFGLSIDFVGGGYSFNSPTSLWWKQLATAVVFGLGIATVLTLIFTPSMLALRIWLGTYLQWMSQLFAMLSMGRSSRAANDWALQIAARRIRATEIIWEEASLQSKADGPTTDEPESDTALPKFEQESKDQASDEDASTDSDDNPLRAAE